MSTLIHVLSVEDLVAAVELVGVAEELDMLIVQVEKIRTVDWLRWW